MSDDLGNHFRELAIELLRKRGVPYRDGQITRLKIGKLRLSLSMDRLLVTYQNTPSTCRAVWDDLLYGDVWRVEETADELERELVLERLSEI